jgi:hypothetical protein
MAFVQIAEVPGVTAAQYDKLLEIVSSGKLADGEMFQVAGPTPEGLCVIDAWETREACDKAAEKWMTAFEEVGVPASAMVEPREFEVHNLIVPG